MTFHKMPLATTKIPPRSLLRLLSRSAAVRPLSSAPGQAGEDRAQKLERIADVLLALTKIERHDYSVLFRLKLGLNRWGPVGGVAVASPGGGAAVAGEGSKAAAEEKEKTAFDVKLEKFEAATKIKVIKEVRAFTDLGLKEAKELVEKAPVVVKKGVTKEEAEQILAKLKEAGATVVME